MQELNRTMRVADPRRRGSVMIAGLLVVFAVATVSAIYLQLSLSKARTQRTGIDTKRSFYMAEAGLAEGFFAVATGESGNVGTEDDPALFADGVFWVEAEECGSGRVSLRSTGLCGAGRTALSMVVERAADTVPSLGFFANTQLTVGSGATIDSYDSRKGLYAAQSLLAPLANGAQSGSNHDVKVGATLGLTTVYGKVSPGPSGVLSRLGTTLITGSTAPLEHAQPMPEIVVPAYPNEGTCVADQRTSQVLGGERGFDLLRAKDHGVLVLQGPLRAVVSELRVDSGASLKFDTTNGPIELIVTDKVELASGSTIASRLIDPRAISIELATDASDPAPQILATGSFCGTIYAPHAAVTIPSSLEIYGAACADTLTLQAGARMHFDRALLEAAEDDTSKPKLLGWRIVQLPTVPLVSLRYDAVTQLLQAGKTLVDAKDSHLSFGVVKSGHHGADVKQAGD